MFVIPDLLGFFFFELLFLDFDLDFELDFAFGMAPSAG